MKKTITIPQSRLRRDSSLYTREPLKIPTANFCWQWGMCARENIFVSLKAKPVLSPYRARANHPLYASVKKKWTLKNTIVLEAQFGLVLNWAFIAQGGRRSTVIEVMYILV